MLVLVASLAANDAYERSKPLDVLALPQDGFLTGEGDQLRPQLVIDKQLERPLILGTLEASSESLDGAVSLQ